MTTAELTLILKKMGAVYGKTVDAELAKSYNLAMGNQPRFRVLKACSHIMQQSVFFPRPAEILSAIHQDRSSTPTPFDEACYWLMFAKGITDPAELSEADITAINQKVGAHA